MNVWTRLSNRYQGHGAAGSSERRLELVAIGLSLLLLLQLLFSGVSLAMLSPPDTVLPSLGDEGMQLVAVEKVTAGQRDEIGARPLFSVTRRPPATSASEATATERGRIKDVELVGVFGSGDTAGVIALVKDVQQRILLGESLQGWTLEAVHPDRVEFARRGQKEILPLRQREINGARQARNTDKQQGSATRARSARTNTNEKGVRTPARLGFGRNR